MPPSSAITTELQFITSASAPNEELARRSSLQVENANRKESDELIWTIKTRLSKLWVGGSLGDADTSLSAENFMIYDIQTKNWSRSSSLAYDDAHRHHLDDRTTYEDKDKERTISFSENDGPSNCFSVTEKRKLETARIVNRAIRCLRSFDAGW